MVMLVVVAATLQLATVEQGQHREFDRQWKRPTSANIGSLRQLEKATLRK